MRLDYGILVWEVDWNGGGGEWGGVRVRLTDGMMLLQVSCLLWHYAAASIVVLMKGDVGVVNEAVFGINEPMILPFSFLDHDSKGAWVGLRDWVDQDGYPFRSPLLRSALKILNVRSLRFPGGTFSQFWNMSSSTWMDQESMCILSPSMCEQYSAWRNLSATFFPSDAFSAAEFADLLTSLKISPASTPWVLSPAGQNTSTLLSSAQVVVDIGGRVVEAGNELYDPHYRARVPTANAYLKYVEPLYTTAPTTSVAVVGSPCPFLYEPNKPCWQDYYVEWGKNLSFPCTPTCPYSLLTVHNYVLNLNTLSSYQPSQFLPVTLSIPSVALQNAKANLRLILPDNKVRLAITEHNAIFYPDVWGNASGPAAEFMRASANSGVHAAHVAASLLTMATDPSTFGMANYHSLFQNCGTLPTCNPLLSQPGFGIMSMYFTAKNNTVGFSAVAQLFTHLTTSATTHTSILSLLPPPTPLLNISILGTNPSPIQGAIFFNTTPCTFHFWALNRGLTPLTILLPTSAFPCTPSSSSQTRTITYNASDPGGWGWFDLNSPPSIPWTTPLHPTISNELILNSNGIEFDLHGSGLAVVEVG